eukprot:7213835-Prymnesium_polylepis.1
MTTTGGQNGTLNAASDYAFPGAQWRCMEALHVSRAMNFDHGWEFCVHGWKCGRNHARCDDACRSVWCICPGVWSAGRAPGLKECNLILTLTTGGHPVTTEGRQI